jgi:uncharacterized protein (DUF3820 family)
MEPYNDLTAMPFGKYKGTVLQEVPASYLHWFVCNCLPPQNDSSKQLLEYVKKSLHALKEESPDLIWPKL